MSSQYICLQNPHDGEWKVFEHMEQLEPYAPNYGCPITSGATPEEAIKRAEIFGVTKDNVEVY